MRKCSVSKCNEKHLARDLCTTHYAQLRRGKLQGQMEPFKPRFKRRLNEGKTCKVKKCDRSAERALMCMAHYQRVQKYGHPQEDKPITKIMGWHYHKTGYIVIPAKGHPNGNKAGSMMEHIRIMSDHVGRPLLPEETVHHKNGVRDDNRIKNLELWSQSQPAGQRVKDKLSWAKQIIKLYG